MTRRWLVPTFLGWLLLTLSLPLAGSAQDGKAKYPDGYRGWTHVKSMVINDRSHPLFEAFAGIHHVYANPAATAALRDGGGYADGSVLVFDLLEVKAEGGALVEGPRKFLAVMVKDGMTYRDTGGWGFEAFSGSSWDQRTVTDAVTQCFACHQAQKAKGYVFSEYRR